MVAPKVDEKGVALRVVEKSASYITPLHAPGVNSISVGGKIRFQTLKLKPYAYALKCTIL